MNIVLQDIFNALILYWKHAFIYGVFLHHIKVSFVPPATPHLVLVLFSAFDSCTICAQLLFICLTVCCCCFFIVVVLFFVCLLLCQKLNTQSNCYATFVRTCRIEWKTTNKIAVQLNIGNTHTLKPVGGCGWFHFYFGRVQFNIFIASVESTFVACHVMRSIVYC